MEWKAATIEEVKGIVNADLKACDPEQTAAFRQFSVKPYLAPILRYGKKEEVVVVARKAGEVMYYEDVEEGFNISPVGEHGEILRHFCNQDKLGIALNRWIAGRNSRQGDWSPSRTILPK